MTVDEAFDFCRRHRASVQWESHIRDLDSDGVVASCFQGDKFFEVVGRDFLEAVEKLRKLIRPPTA